MRATGLEERLEKYYAALCMSPGNSTILDVIRELQRQYREIRGTNYEPPSCDLLLRLK